MQCVNVTTSHVYQRERRRIDITILNSYVGSAIKELASVTGAKIHVSSSDEVYPGTNDRYFRKNHADVIRLHLLSSLQRRDPCLA